MRRTLVIEIAGLGWPLWERVREVMPHLSALAAAGQERRLRPPFPAVTVTCQATFATGALVAGHGMVANGLFHRELQRAMFWEQSAALVEGEPLWRALKRRRPDARTALLFWQNSIGSENDVVLTPAPIHKHGHGMINSCYSVPAGLYDRLAARLGEFKLRWYWGPFVSVQATQWIAAATAAVLREFTPDLALTYLPHLDYEQQRRGPLDPRALRDAAATDAALDDLLRTARELDYAVLVWGDYAIEPVAQVVQPNRLLRAAGLLNVRRVKGREHLDLGTSAAFAMVDHQAAHVYALRGTDTVGRIRQALAPETGKGVGSRLCEAPEGPTGKRLPTPGGFVLLDDAERARRGLTHPRCGDVVLEAAEGAWFDYRWWSPGAAPDFAGHVDIHRKPGFDPCELLKALGGLRTGSDPTRVRGSHGRQTPTVLIADRDVPLPPAEMVSLEALKDALADRARP